MKKFVSVICLIISALLMLTSCSQAQSILTGLLSDKEENSRAVSVVIGAHANFPYRDAVSYIYDDVYGICKSGGEISFVVADGEPFIAADYDVKKPNGSYSSSKKKELTEEAASTIIKKAASLTAVTPEVDTLAALSLAADKLRASECAEKTLIVLDSGLSTAGLLNFAEYLLIEETPEDIVDALDALHALPELEGIRVRVTGLGRVSGEQETPSADMLDKLRGIWTAILTSSGASEVKNDPTPLSDSGSCDELPEVSAVPVILSRLIAPKASDGVSDADGVSDTDEDSSDTDGTSDADEVIGKVVRFDETRVRFAPDSAELSDRDAAVHALSYAGELLAANPELRVHLVGTTASFGGDGEKLSLERAEEVKKLLTEMGCCEEQIICHGFGRRQSILRVKDTDSEGNLLPDKAKLNRAVFLIGSGSSAARSLGLE